MPTATDDFDENVSPPPAAPRATAHSITLFEMDPTVLTLRHPGVSVVLADGARLDCSPAVGMPHLVVLIGSRQFRVDARDVIRAALNEAGYEGDVLVPAKAGA
jgi:hypothetical protein